MKNVLGKFGNMRKAQDFTVYPASANDGGMIKVQSGKSIGQFNPETGRGVLNTRGCYFPDLAFAKPFWFPEDFVKQCVEAQLQKGDLIGSSSIAGIVRVG